MPDERNISGQENSGPPSGPTEPGHIPEDAVVSEPSSPVTEDIQEERSGDGAESREPPALKVEGRSTKVIDITSTVLGASGQEPDREPWEMTREELDAKAKKEKAGRSRRPKKAEEKSGPEGKDRSAKAAPAKKQREQSSQSKGGKATPGGGGSAPAVAAAASAKPLRPIQDAKIVYLKLSELHPFHTFRQHPFAVNEQEPRMKQIIASVREKGVISPATVRPEKDGSGYEIVAGHCRCRASELAGFTELPCIVREMTDHEAVQEMKDSNKQRGPMLPMELARLLDLELEDLKHQGTQLKNVAEGDVGKRSSEIVGELHGMSYKKVTDYVRLTSLVPELQAMVDGFLDEKGQRKSQLGFTPAVHLSYIRPRNQQLIAVSMDSNEKSISVSQAKRLRDLDSKKLLNGDVIDGILCEEQKEEIKVVINEAELNKYFGPTMTPRQMKDQILALLDEWKEKQPPEKKAPEQTAER